MDGLASKDRKELQRGGGEKFMWEQRRVFMKHAPLTPGHDVDLGIVKICSRDKLLQT